MAKSYITVNVDAKAHRRLKQHCKAQGKIMSAELTKAINNHLDNEQRASGK